MASNDPKVLQDIAYAAFQTHYNSTRQEHWKTAEQHWQDNPNAHTLWLGLVKGVITNVVAAQTEGRIPHILMATVAEVPAGLLPGLGAPLPPPARPGPADVARKLAHHIRDSEAQATRLGDPRAAALDAAPGLAVGRCTEGCDDATEGEHKAVTDAIETHIRGGDDSEG